MPFETSAHFGWHAVYLSSRAHFERTAKENKPSDRQLAAGVADAGAAAVGGAKELHCRLPHMAHGASGKLLSV